MATQPPRRSSTKREKYKRQFFKTEKNLQRKGKTNKKK